MSDTGSYWIRAGGRSWRVEPIRERGEREDDVCFRNGGISGDEMKHKAAVRGGSIPEAESEITEANGYRNIEYTSNPMDVVERELRKAGQL